MNKVLVTATVAFFALAVPAYAQEDVPAAGKSKASACTICHGELEDDAASAWGVDVHAEVGLGCHDCHGGDPSPDLAEDLEGSMDPARGFKSPPGRLEIARFCSRCHSDATFMRQFDPQARVDQWAEYQTSVHGLAHAAGDPVPATCTDCHGIHGIRPVDAPDSPVHASNVPETCSVCHSDEERMRPYGLPVDQLEQYLGSVHATALLEHDDTSAPACNDCHGNHGATPPGVQSVANVCGQCHGREAKLFRASIKKELFDAMEVSECAECHGNHLVTHPTPEFFRSGSGPATSKGSILSVSPLRVEVQNLEGGEQAEVRWESVLRPALEAGDERLTQLVVVGAAGLSPIELDATVQPGSDPAAAGPLMVSSGGLTATLWIEPPYGTPVRGGDAVAFRLVVEAAGDASLTGVTVETVLGDGLHNNAGSICLTCHSVGDECDVATEVMYSAIATLDRELREAERLLHEAEIAGMFVSDAEFELRRGGQTASVEARALLHTFDPEAVLERVEEGRGIAATALEAGQAALAELQFRRKGLAVSLVLIAFVLVGLFLKIRAVERSRQASR